MNDSPAFSVIIPTFNRSEFVRNCLLALGESGVHNLEVIVVDDGSTDDTEQVVHATDPQAIYIRQENQGPAAARNRGFERSRGRYVGFLDCDDEWLPGAPAEAVAWLDRHPDVDVLFAEALMGNRDDGFQSWIESAGQSAFFELPHEKKEDGYRVLAREPLFQRMLVRNSVFLGSTLVRRTAFERSGMFDPTLCGAADWNLWLRMAATMTFAFRAEPLAIYTKHPDGMSNDTDGMNREFCMALRRLREQVSLSSGNESLLDQQLRHHLFNYAYRAYDRGEYPEARRRFLHLMKETGWEFRSCMYVLLCSLPGGMPGALRNAKHKFAGQTPRPVLETVPRSKAVLNGSR
ncbi:MAG: glycosyltransferase [Planctomycetes bacterium]|nr:glycosyltransferase [Planctomycetota bacterium]